MATGRTLFSRLKPVIDGLSALLRALPRGLFLRTWFLWENAPGKAGILIRYLYARRLSRCCGDNVMIGRRCIVMNWENLEFGRNITLQPNCYIDGLGGITIGDNVSIAHATSIMSFEHSWDDPSLPIKYNPLRTAHVKIGSDVWIGAGVRILAGAELESRTVIAAGCVVTRGIYGHAVYGGVPAKLLKQLD